MCTTTAHEFVRCLGFTRISGQVIGSFPSYTAKLMFVELCFTQSQGLCVQLTTFSNLASCHTYNQSIKSKLYCHLAVPTKAVPAKMWLCFSEIKNTTRPFWLWSCFPDGSSSKNVWRVWQTSLMCSLPRSCSSLGRVLGYTHTLLQPGPYYTFRWYQWSNDVSTPLSKKRCDPPS